MAAPFYESIASEALRFGDVVAGFTLTVPHQIAPHPESCILDYRIEVSHPHYAAVLSPCCSIGDSTILLSPLIQVIKSWQDNPYFAEDLTRINRVMKAEQTVSASRWESFSQEEKMRRLAVHKPSYVYVEHFIYAPHPLLPIYECKRRGTVSQIGHYMVDFRKLFKVDCPEIRSATACPLQVRKLQLSRESRAELRNKLTFFFGRIPSEDLSPLEATPPAGLA